MTARPLVVTRFVAVTPEAAARLREDPAALEGLREGPRESAAGAWEAWLAKLDKK